MADDDRSRRNAIRVEVVFALPAQQILQTVSLADGATVADAIEAAGLAALFPQEPIDALATGIWGTVVPREQRVRDGDRVEVYRPLELDPRDLRRRLAAVGRTMRRSPDSDDEPA